MMAKIDPQKMTEMSQSKYGKYVEIPEPKFRKFFYNVFLKNTPLKIFMNGAITTGVFVYWFFSKNIWPLTAWFFYIFFINISGLVYWQLESRRLGLEIKRTEEELNGIRQEIEERKRYFSELKKNIEEDAERGSKPK